MGKAGKMGALNSEILDRFRGQTLSDAGFKIAMNAATRGNLQDLVLNRNVLNEDAFKFSNEVENKAEITDQKRSGTCWMYADVNWLRLQTMRAFNMESITFSHNWVMFFDKLEKSNLFLNAIIERRACDLDDRELMHILHSPAGDGGEWALFWNVIQKYGLVPMEVMPDTANKENSRYLNGILFYKLREFAGELRAMHDRGKTEEALYRRKYVMIEQVFRILSIFLGLPPDRFDWSWRDKDKKYHQEQGITPRQFAQKYIPDIARDMVCIANSPLDRTPYEKVYTQKLFNNAIDGDVWQWLNMPMDILKMYALKILNDNNHVLFGCDVLQQSHTKLGILHHEIYNMDDFFGTQFNGDRRWRFDYGQSVYTHCMVLAGVELANDRPVRWKVENSWGAEVGQKGIFTMSDAWFDEHMIVVWIPKQYLQEDHLRLASQDPVVLPPWFPI
ncbi:aminopeptidase [bacterium]|nr:aminopeptidase [candidate division CSSED10-310 bacterium]